jgi:hypothetical protein
VTDLEARLDRLESLDEIRQLVAKYALSLDMRDLDAHVNLFAEDIRVSREQVGRAHLKRWLDDTLRLQFTGTSHHMELMVGKVLRQVFVPRLKENRQVRPHHDIFARRPSRLNQGPKSIVHFRCAPGQIYRLHLGKAMNQLNQLIADFWGKFFRALWPGLDVAVGAGQIALAPQVNLQYRDGQLTEGLVKLIGKGGNG